MLRFSPVLLVLAALFAAGCVSTDTPPSPPPSGAGIQLSEPDASVIGRKIWQNECAGTVEGLTSWNTGEDFPSLGIGHFIWYVPGRPGPFQESFPQLLAYMEERGTAIPGWLAEAKGCPWNSRADFLKEQQSPRMKELRQFLANTVSVQTGFIVRRLELSLPEMQKATPAAADKERLRSNFYLMAGSRNGLYALIDYVNFKGEGIKPRRNIRARAGDCVMSSSKCALSPMRERPPPSSARRPSASSSDG